MRGKPGEITVFLSLITVCCLSLFLGLVESARTAGARLYLEMAANSAMSSVMSQYNRNLWDMYHLLFLESESEDAVRQSFDTYLSFYMNQENLYPMKLEETEIQKVSYMTDFGGEPLEKEIASYMKYRFPDVVEEMGHVADAAKEASKAGDFKQLFDVCLRAGTQTRELEKRRKEMESCLTRIQKLAEKTKSAADLESNGNMERHTNSLIDEANRFPKFLDLYREELGRISDYLEDLKKESMQAPEDADAVTKWNQEIQAFEQVENAAREQLCQYEEMGNCVDRIREDGTEILALLDKEMDEEDVDWPMIRDILDGWMIPDISKSAVANEEKTLSLDRLEKLLSEGVLSMVLPKEAEISERRVSLNGIPSEGEVKSQQPSHPLSQALLYHFVVNEYCILNFDSFMEERSAVPSYDEQVLQYEMEYLISGNNTDRKNLLHTIENLLFIRASMNLCYLSATPERKAEADGLAASLSGGNIPLQVILSFFVLTLWSVGEAVLDVRTLLAGGSVPFWKSGETWKLSLEQLLSLEFVDMAVSSAGKEDDAGYGDYLRILCFLMNREEKNARIMDLLQWNVRTKQPDFAVTDCMGEIEARTRVTHRHLFFSKEEYKQTVRVTGGY